jgi:protein SCO1/2
MKRVHISGLFVLLVFIIPVSAFAFFAWYEKNLAKLPVLREKKDLTSFELFNQDGKPATVTDWKNKIVVAGFFYTHCPTICPKMIQNLKVLQQKTKGCEDLQIVSFTVDPEHDSAGQLKSYCSSRKIDTQNWNFLTGSKQQIYNLARSGFKVVATEGDGGPEDFIHTEEWVLLDAKQRIRGYYDGLDKVELDHLILDIKKLEHEK